mmetsp:Transcript_31175/g.85772  ORF Transcript_31175/g.85772 Transcript_31175/m.85772 type:complete len:450 (-) Transcript_31175:20-1369(-)
MTAALQSMMAFSEKAHLTLRCSSLMPRLSAHSSSGTSKSKAASAKKFERQPRGEPSRHSVAPLNSTTSCLHVSSAQRASRTAGVRSAPGPGAGRGRVGAVASRPPRLLASRPLTSAGKKRANSRSDSLPGVLLTNAAKAEWSFAWWGASRPNSAARCAPRRTHSLHSRRPFRFASNCRNLDSAAASQVGLSLSKPAAHAAASAALPATGARPGLASAPGASPPKDRAASQSHQARGGRAPSSVMPRGFAGRVIAKADIPPPQEAWPTSVRVARIFPRVTCGVQAPSPSMDAKYETGKDTPFSLQTAKTRDRKVRNGSVASKRATTKFIFPGGKSSKPQNLSGSVGRAALDEASSTSACMAACTWRNSPEGRPRKCSPKKRNVMCSELFTMGSKPTSVPAGNPSISDGDSCKALAMRSRSSRVPSSRMTARKALWHAIPHGGAQVLAQHT